MGRRKPKAKTLEELDKQLDAIVENVDDMIDEVAEKAADAAVEAILPEEKDEPEQPPAETKKLVALQNYLLWDGLFVYEGDLVEIEANYADRLLTHTPAFRLATPADEAK